MSEGERASERTERCYSKEELAPRKTDAGNNRASGTFQNRNSRK